MVINPNKISIDFKDTPYAKGNGASVHTARDGSISNYGIEYTKDCAVQKEMDSNMIYTGTTQNEIVSEVTKNLPEDTFDPADFISQSINGEDAKEIEGDGSILEEYVDSTLERAIEKVKTERKANSDALDRYTEKEKEKQEFSDELQAQIEMAAQLAAKMPGLGDAAVKYYIEQEADLTPAAIGNSAGVTAMPAVAERASYEEMKPQIDHILEENGLQEDPAAEEAAKFLYEKDIPVTPENIEKYTTWQETKETPQEVINERIWDAVREGTVPQQADISQISYKEAAQKWDTLKNVTEDELRAFYPEEAGFITAKRQMEEIRLKMTAEAAGKMERKGIHVDISNLTQIVEELKQMEKEACRNVFDENNISYGQEQVDRMASALQAKEQIWQAPAAILGKTIGQAADLTLHNMSEIGKTAIQEELSKNYEAVGTQVRKDLGDSMTKAFQNVDAILEDLGFDKTSENQRAVRILAYNQMEITKDAVLSMKDYDAKVTSVLEQMKPAAVAKMIEKQQNPLEMTMDEIEDALQEISGEMTEDDTPLRKFLWKLDHQGAITPEERKSMIGIYRLIDKVEKSDGAVIGQLVKEGRELTFSSLLSAVRTRRAEGKEFEINDDFGSLESRMSGSETISEQIGAAFGSRVIHQLKRELSPGAVRQSEDDMACEQILEACETPESQAEEAAYYEMLAQNIKEIASSGDEMVHQCLEAAGIPATLQNIREMKAYLTREKTESDILFTEEESESVLDVMDQPEELESMLDTLDQEHFQEIESRKQADDITYDTLQNLIRMAGSISFYRQMRQQTNTFSVPIMTDQGVTSCHVTVLQGQESEKGTVEISLNSEKFGKLQATFKVVENKVSGFVTCENEQDISELTQDIEKDLEMNGFAMERMDVARGARHSFQAGDKEQTANSRLYQVAKIVVTNVQRKEADQ